MMPRVRATSVLMLLVLGVARGQDQPEEPPRTVEVPAAPAPALDGVLGSEEWRDAARFEARADEDVLARVRVQRHGRQLFFACETARSPWALGLRLNFADPVSQRANAVLVTPLQPPLPPMTALRQLPNREPEQVSSVSADVRFSFPATGGVTMEVRVPMDLVEFARSDRPYFLGVELWDLEARRTLAGSPMARLKPTDTWGADAPKVDAAEHPALGLLENLDAVTGTLNEASGWKNGRRKSAPLDALQQRLDQAIAAYPDYVSLRAIDVQVRVARGDLEGGLATLDRLAADFPAVATRPQHLLIRMEFLRNLERAGEALALLDEHRERLEGNPVVARERAVIARLRDALRLEREIREREAARDDLPRVSVRTNKGEFVIELLEDDAPNAVANFISLAERGFYDGTRFFWCEGGRRVLGGDPNTRDEDPENDGFGDPGYLIESNPGRRLNLAYMVAFTDNRLERRTEGCTFIIHLMPFPALDGVNTVFGRVIEGHAALRRLEYYDVIEGMKVLRKRDHPYEPVKRP